MELRLVEFDARELLAQEAANQFPRASAKGVGLEAVLPDKPLPIRADPERMRQAVSNLLVDAVKYTPAGGMVWPRATQEAESIVVRAQDNGMGVSADVLPRIFELFTQEPRAKAAVPGGLGVGLAVVREIAELQEGVAEARSGGAGRGSEFTLRLPRHGPRARPVEEAGESAAAAGQASGGQARDRGAQRLGRARLGDDFEAGRGGVA